MPTTPSRTLILTLGDPAGVGPEVLCKALAHAYASQAAPPHVAPSQAAPSGAASGGTFGPGIRPLVFGELELLSATAQSLALPIRFRAEGSPPSQDAPPSEVAVEVRSFGLASPGSFEVGRVSALCGEASFRYFEAAVRACQSGEAAGIVTAPLSKEAMNLAGHHFVGHTDILEQMTGAEAVVMALVHPRIVVSHVTDHLPLRKALDAITEERILEVVRLTWKSLWAMGRVGPEGLPRIALAGVNPHAGENGLFGREELDVLIPAMRRLEAEGMPASGPLPGDTVFAQALKGRFEAVIAMYHDQGFGPMKTLDMAQGVNCTLGLPFVRTSPDHGTAFDIAGKGVAEPDSMLSAWNLACRLVEMQGERG